MAIETLLLQAAKAAAYYFGLVVLMRLSGKRLAGQTTMFDLLVLITLGVVLQGAALDEGFANALVFVTTVFVLHKTLTAGCARYPRLRHMVRGAPRPLVQAGRVLGPALEREGMSREELEAGLRKLGFPSPEAVELAVLEETGHISAIPRK